MQKKTLYLIRHAKAEVFSFLSNDFTRHLLDKGKERALRIATELKPLLATASNLQVISSAANRAHETALIFSEIIPFPASEIQLTKKIYEASYLDILKQLTAVDNQVDNLIIFGHNPGLSDLTNYLCGSDIDLKTAHVAIITLPETFTFAELSGGTAQLQQIIS